MAVGREKSDGRVVVQGRVMATETADTRGAKAITASKWSSQLDLFAGTAENLKESPAATVEGLPETAQAVEPKSVNLKNNDLPPMTMEEVANEVNLMIAWNKVASNKGAAGPDRQGIQQVRKHIGFILPALHRELLQGSYLPGDIRRVWIPKGNGDFRGLGIPNVVDRIVQQATHQVLSPHYEREFHNNSHGFRPNRSCHTAVAQAREYLAQGHEFVVDIDLEKFFDTVHHDRLMAKLAEQISDKRLLKMLRKMLQARIILPDGLVTEPTEGTPQGGPLSPLLSNIVLDELDRELAQRGLPFVRYADDCNIFVRSERAGKRVMESIATFIEKRLRLKVNKAKSAVAKPETRHFLGFRLKRNAQSGEVEVLLSARSKSRIDDKIRALTPRNWGSPFGACIHKVNEYLIGWIGFFRICSAVPEIAQTLKDLDGHIRRRLRAIKLKQWKCKRIIYRQLRTMGVSWQSASKAIYGGNRSIWKMVFTNAVQSAAMPPLWFEEQGLVSLVSRWPDKSMHALVKSVRRKPK